MNMVRKGSWWVAASHWPLAGLVIKDGAWVAVDSPRVSRYNLACTVHAGKIFVIGGNYSGNDVEIFDPNSESWALGPEFPQSLSNAYAVSWVGNLWVLGGFNDATGKYNNIVYRLDEVEKGWKDTGIYVDGSDIQKVLPGLIVNKDIMGEYGQIKC